MRFLFAAAAMAIALGSAVAAPDESERAEFGRVHAFENGAPGGRYFEKAFTGLEAAKAVRVTALVVRQEKHRQWAPTITVKLGRVAMLTDENVAPEMNLAVSGLGAMDIRINSWRKDKPANERMFKRRLKKGQKVRLEISWAIPGTLLVQVDGQESHSLPMAGPIEGLSFTLSSGYFRLEDLVFEPR